MHFKSTAFLITGFVRGENLCDRFILELVLECNCYKNPMWLNTKVPVPPVTVLQKVKKTEVSIWLWHLTAWLRPVWVFPAPVKHQEKKPTIYKKSQICVPKKFCQNNIIIKAYPQIHQTHAMKKLDFSSLAYRAWIAQKTLIKLHNDAFFIWSFVCSGIIYIFHSTG